jgi:hypothetical protein
LDPVRGLQGWKGKMLGNIKKIWIDPVWSKVIATGIIAIFVAFAALFTHTLTAAFFIRLLTARVPFWGLLATLVILIFLLPYWWRAIRTKKPALHVAWHGSAGWGTGGILQKGGEMERVLRIQGPTVITSSFLEEPVFVTGIDLKDAAYAGPNFQMFEVKPGAMISRSLLLNFRGFKPAKGKPFWANLTLVDIKGKRYPLTPALLRAFPGEEVPPAEPTKPKPVVNSAWRFNSWCWALVGSEKVVRIVSEGRMQFTNTPERFTITGGHVNGFETVGGFDGFPVEQDQEFYRSISLNIRGMSPEGRVPIKASVVLTDLQGNEFPLKEEIFTPYDEPTRWVGGLAWPKN